MPHKFNLTVFGFHTFLTTGRQKIVGEAVSYRQVTFQSIGQGTKPLASRSENSGRSRSSNLCRLAQVPPTERPQAAGSVARLTLSVSHR